MTWQAIESAPRDGSRIDLWVHWPEHDRRDRTADAFWNVEEGEWQLGEFHAGQFVHRPTATHWMPRPEAPEAS